MVRSDKNVHRFPSRGFMKWNILKVFPLDLVLILIWNRQALTHFIQCPCFKSRLGISIETLYRQRASPAFERNTTFSQGCESERLFISLEAKGCHGVISAIS